MSENRQEKYAHLRNGLAYWRLVEKTDPRNTKHVNQRGGFTAIGAHSQIMATTEQLGPVGGDWWWELTPTLLNNDTVVLMRVEVHHPLGDHPIIQFGCCELVKNGRVDTDAYKKATTDGLTKCLSYLGNNADVFMGRFDDNKYVQAALAEAQEKERKQRAEDRAAAKAGQKQVEAGPITPAQVMSIGKLAEDVHGKDAEDYMQLCIDKMSVHSIHDLTHEQADKWIKKLNIDLDKKEAAR